MIFRKIVKALSNENFLASQLKAFISITLIAFLIYNSNSMLNITLPKFAKELGASAQAIGLLSGMFAMCALLMRPVSGQIVDNENKLVLLRICLLVLLVSVFGFTLSTNYWMLIIFRGLNGLAWGIGSTLCMTIASSCFENKNMVTGIGIYALGQTLAQTIAPLFALPIADRFGYNALYYVNVFIMILCIGLSFFLKIENSFTRNKKYSFGLKRLVAVHAILPAALTLGNTFAKSAINAFLVIYTGTMNISNIGIFFTLQSVTIFIFRPFISKLADRYGTIKVLMPCEFLIVMGMILIAWATGLPMVLLAAVILGIAFSGEQPILMAECIRRVEPSERGNASNTSYIGVDIGFFVGSNLAGLLVAYTGYRNMFMLMAAVVMIFSFIFLYFYSKDKKEEVKSVIADD